MDYFFKMKSCVDVVVLFLLLVIEGEKVYYGFFLEFVFVIFILIVVVVFYLESIKLLFGIEVWWKGFGGQLFYWFEFFFSLLWE